MFNRWIEAELLDTLESVGAGCIPFSPLAQGLLTDRYLDGVPEGSRASQGKSLSGGMLSEENLVRIRALHEIAQRRGQSLAQMAILWTLRDPRVTSALIGASSPRTARGRRRSARGCPLQRRGVGRDRPLRHAGREYRPVERVGRAVVYGASVPSLRGSLESMDDHDR